MAERLLLRTGYRFIEGQLLQAWYFAMNERVLAPEADRTFYRQMFPGITSLSRPDQKRRLARACEKYKKRRDIREAKGTEDRPLVNRR